MSNFTLFTSDPSSQSSGNAFDQDAFQDITLSPTNNTGLTSSSSTNPLGLNFANDDGVRFGSKTLYIKDLVLVQDHALWISGKPTYQIIWHENYPQAQGYLFGNIQITRGRYVSIRQVGDGIGITGVLRKCAFIVTGDTAATATAQLAVDGINTTTIDFSNTPNPLIDGNSVPLTDNKYNLYVNASANQTKDLHDYRLTAIQTTTMRLVGVVVYSENSGANVDVFSGTSYVNKNRVATSLGATLALPSYSGALGGRSLYYKTTQGGYTSAIQAAPNLQSIATGSTGTNLLTVTTGQGGSFPVGSGIAAFWGSTGFLGSVTTQSTDTLTVSPTLPFGISGLIYKTWAGGQSLAINSSQLILSSVIDFNRISGFSNYLSDLYGAWRVWGDSGIIGATTFDTIWPGIIGNFASLGFIQVDGMFSAADIEWVGQGRLHVTASVNGLPAWNALTGQTGCVKTTVFTDAGPGWNSFRIGYGSTFSALGINRINLYQRTLPQGLSYGLLAQMDTLPNFVNPQSSVVNATFIAPGTYQRYFSDQLFFQGGWIRVTDVSMPGGLAYVGATSNSVLKFQWYGKNYAVLGANNGGSALVSLDSAANTGITFNVMNVVSTEGFHSITLTNQSGSSLYIAAIDVTRTQGEIKNIQSNSAVYSAPSSVRTTTVQKFTVAGSGTYSTPIGCKRIRVRAVGGGGGGGGSGTAGATTAGDGTATTFGTSLISAGGGVGGNTSGSGGAGGTSSLAQGLIGRVVAGSGGGGSIGTAATSTAGASGAPSSLGGGGASVFAGAGGAGAANTGGGGAGAGVGNNGFTGASGGSGGTAEAVITNPAATYSFTVGAGGTAGAAGAGGAIGGIGGTGVLEVEEDY